MKIFYPKTKKVFIEKIEKRKERKELMKTQRKGNNRIENIIDNYYN